MGHGFRQFGLVALVLGASGCLSSPPGSGADFDGGSDPSTSDSGMALDAGRNCDVVFESAFEGANPLVQWESPPYTEMGASVAVTDNELVLTASSATGGHPLCPHSDN